jgi:hypothetical protein
VNRHSNRTAITLAAALVLAATAAGADPSRSPAAPAAPAQPPAGLPAGAIVAFMPRPGGDYADMAGLKRWLDAHG